MEPKDIELTPEQHAEAAAYRDREDSAAFLNRHRDWNKPLALDFDGEHSSALEDARFRLAAAEVGALHASGRSKNAVVFGQARDLGEAFQSLQPAADMLVRRKQIDSLQRAYDAAGHDDFLQHIKAHPELSYLLTEGDLKHFSGLNANFKRFRFAWKRGVLNNVLGKLRDRQADGDSLTLAELARLDQLSAELRQALDSSDGSFLGYSAKTLGEMGPFLGEVILGGLEGAGAGALAGSVIPGAGTASGAAGGAARATLINAGRVLRFLSRATPTKVGAGMGSYMSAEHISTGLSYDRYVQEFTSKHGRTPSAAELESLGTRANLSGHAQSLVELAPLYTALHLAGGAGQKLMRQIGLKNPYAVGLLGTTAAIAGQTGVETLEETTQQAIELGLSPVDHSGSQWADELTQSARAGATAGLWLGLIPGGLSGVRHFQGQQADNSLGELKQALDEQEKIDAAHAGAATLQGIHQAVQASDLAKLSDPAALKTLAAEMVKDSPLAEISLDSASLAQVISSESITVKSALQHQFPELADQIASQSEVTMPLADYIAHIAPLTKADELLPGARLDQDRLTLSEAQQRETELPKILKAANAALKQGRLLGDSAEKVREEVQQMARDQGVDEEQAMSWGYLYAHFFATQARRAGSDPYELFKGYGWNLKTAETAAGSRDRVSPETPDAAPSQTQNATSAALAYASSAESSQPEGLGEVREGESVVADRASEPLRGSDTPAPIADSDQPIFFDEVGMTKLGTWDAGLKELHSHADLARVSAAIARDPQENMIAVATDKKGKILAVHSVTRGTLDRSSAHPREVITWLAAYPKAAHLWLSHNHPGGDSSLSPQDIKVSEGIEEVLRSTHIAYHPMIAVANNGTDIRWTDTEHFSGIASPASGKHLAPHVKRQFVKQTGAGFMLSDPSTVIRFMKAEERENQQALILLNTRNRVVAVVPYDLTQAHSLRGRLKPMLETLHRGSPARFVAYDGPGTATLRDFRNLSAFGRAAGIELLDAITRDRPTGNAVSMREDASSKGTWSGVESQSEYYQSGLEDADKRIGQRTPANFTPEEKAAWESELARRDDKAEVLRQLNQHAGTPWAKQAIEGVFTRAAARLLLEGKTPDFQSALESNSVKSLRSSLEKGVEEFWWRISVKNGLLSEAAKPVNNVSSTFLNCRPSDDCAQYCYATKGNYIFSGSMVKSELVSLAVEMDPARAAKAVADEYKRTREFLEKKALRLFDKGDISAEWLPFIAELEKQGVRCHIFSKRPELLRQVSPFHVRLLSIDQSNGTLSEQNPDLPVAYVYTERSQLEEIAKLVKRGQMQVILPVKMGSRVLGEDEVKPIRAIPGASKYLCPIDAGVKALGDGRNNTWNCTKCDKAGGVGCYVGQSTERIQAYNEHKELDDDAQLIERIIAARSRLQSAGGPGVSAPDGHLSAGAGASVGRVHQRGDAGLDSEMDSLLGELLARLDRGGKTTGSSSRTGRTGDPHRADARVAPSSGDAESGSTYHQPGLEPSRSAAEEGELHQDRTESYRDRDWNEPEDEDAGDLDKVITRKSVDAATAAILAIPDPQAAAARLISDYLKIRHYIRPNNKLAEANAFLLRIGTKYHDPAGLMLAIGATVHPDLHPDVIRSFVGKIDRQIKASVVAKAMAPQATAAAKPWPANFPDVQVMTGYQTMLDHPDFNAAKKHHDAAAARRLVEGLVDEAKLASLKQQFPDAALVAIHRPGSSNAIPLAFAEHLSDSQGWSFNRSIQESKAAKHTGKGAWHRFARRTQFTGDIEEGRKYIIVDDMVTLGANASELRQYIEAKGGRVAAVVSLASHVHTKNLALRSSTRQKLREKFGDAELSQWMKELGLYHGNIDALTDPEAEMILLSSGSLGSIREKIEATRAAPEDSRAPRGSYSSTTHLISLYKTADRSTFLHESAHFFLEVMRDLAQRDGASPDLVADWQLILQEFGTDGKIDRAGHELFARSFEAWLMKGEAPSPELRPLFQQFRDWLLAVYHSLTGLNHKASPEVKGLFSRMLASDEAVAHTLSQQLKTQLSPELAKKLGINEAEWQDYLAAAATAKDEAVAAIDQVYWRPVIDAMNSHADKVRMIRAEVEAEIKAKPAWLAIEALRLGAEGQHLNTSALKRRFGDELLAKLPRSVPSIHSSQGRLNADDFAQQMGYADAGELIHDLIRFGSLEDRIREEVETRLRGEDDPMSLARSEGARAVNAALRKGKIGEAGAGVIARELVILKGGGAKPWQLIERARAAARQLMLSSPARKILAPAIYARAAEREAANATRLLTKIGSKETATAAGDLASGSVRRGSEAADTILGIDANRAEAAAAKERQLMQFMLAREAEKARDERDAIYSRLLDPVSKEVDAEYKALIEGIRRAIHLYSNPDNTKPDLIAFLLRERKPEAGSWITPVPDAVLDAFAAEGGLAHHQAMSLVVLDEYAATIEALKITGARKTLAHSAAKKKAEEAEIKKLVEGISGGSLAAHSQLIQQNARGLRDFIRSDAKLADTEAWKNLQGFTAAFLRYEQIVALLDGDGLKQRIGEATRQLWSPIDQAQHLENDLILEANQELLKSIDAMSTEQRASMDDIITVPEVARQFKRSEILMVLLNLGNRGNAEKLTIGYTWSGAQLEAILAHLTPEDAHLAQKIWDDVGKWWPKINALHLRTTGHGIGKVKATRLRVRVTDRGGVPVEVELEGGYFPVIYDPNADKSGRISNFDEMAALRMFQGGTLRAETNQSFTKSRTKAAYPILLDLGALRSHIHRVAHDLSHREAIADTMRTLQHADVRQAIEQRLGRGAYMQLQPAIEAIAKGSEIDRGQQKLNAALRYLRSGVTLMGLGFRFSTALVQTLGFANAIEIIGPAALARGVAASFDTPAGYESARAAMLAKSGEMRHRHNMLDRDLADSVKQLGNESGAVDKFRQYSFWMINEMDRIVTTPTWWGAYLDHLQKFPEQEAEAIALADRAVRLSQGAGGMKDLPGWMRGDELKKLFTMFYMPMNAVFNRLWAHSRAFRLAWQQDKRQAMGLIPNLLMRYLLLTTIPSALLALIRGKLPDDDESWLTWLAKNNLLYLAGTLPFARDIIPSLFGAGTGQMTPASQAIGALKAAGKHAFDEQPDFGNPDAWLDSADLIGYAFRLPLDQLTTIIHNLLEAGRVGDEPLGVKDLLRRR